MLQIQHLTLTHKSDLRVLIHDLSLTLSGVERLAVIGEEGDGKSTLLETIVHWPAVPDWCLSEGSINSGGERIAFLSQENSFSDSLSVYDYCCSCASFPDASWQELYDVCQLIGMSPDLAYRQSPVLSLSGGEKLKLRLMLLMLSSPTMLVLDEPSNDLDLNAL